MKKTIHPKFGDTKIITTNQEELVIKSAMSVLNQSYHLSVDSLNHPAWTGKKRQSILSDNSSRLKKNFSGIEDL